MRIPPLPLRWLVHDIVYEEYTGERDIDGRDILADPVKILNVRFDNSVEFDRDVTQTTEQAQAIIFVDANHSVRADNGGHIGVFKRRSRITFNGETYVIRKVVDCYHPFENKIRHWELEVL